MQTSLHVPKNNVPCEHGEKVTPQALASTLDRRFSDISVPKLACNTIWIPYQVERDRETSLPYDPSCCPYIFRGWGEQQTSLKNLNCLKFNFFYSSASKQVCQAHPL
jgi:hypothetical protein